MIGGAADARKTSWGLPVCASGDGGRKEDELARQTASESMGLFPQRDVREGREIGGGGSTAVGRTESEYGWPVRWPW